MTAKEALDYRENPKRWFQGFGRYRDEQTRKPLRGKANVLQRRVFEHKRRCQAENKPCRMVVLKYRRAGSSTSGACCIYMDGMNFNARLGVIGTDYKASSNMLDMVSFYGEHDDFPGWHVGVQATDFKTVPWEDKTEKIIATKLVFAHDSSVELYTAANPESARSAGLTGYHATECGRWPGGGELDAGETLTAMRNTLPKKGYHFAMEESTAKGAQGAFYETCRTARWPDYADWWKQWQTCWPLTEVEYGRDLQFVFIFAAWFEDERHIERLTPEQQQRVEETLDAEPWYQGEKELIALYAQDGPHGKRLGGEVDATVWEQLAWRRGMIKTVCTKRGLDEFKEEYPSNPLEAFRASGSPALDQEGLTALELASRNALPEHGILSLQQNDTVTWSRMAEGQCVYWLWEKPIVGARYLITCDPMSGSEQVTGTGEKDRHAVFVLRDAFTDTRGRYYPVKVAARIRPPCQFEDNVLARQIALLARYFGNCMITVEANCGAAVIKLLYNEHHCRIYQREDFDHTSQKFTQKLGWWNDTGSRRIAIAELQAYVREQRLDLLCPHAVGECKTLIIDNKGKAVAGGSNHDDDPLALAIGLVCLPSATPFTEERLRPPEMPDARRWKAVGG